MPFVEPVVTIMNLFSRFFTRFHQQTKGHGLIFVELPPLIRPPYVKAGKKEHFA